MAEHLDGGNKSQDQIEDEAWACFRLAAEGRYVREIAAELKLSRETVKRRLSILSHETPPKDFARALEIERLGLVVRAITNEMGREDRDTAKLANALIAASKRLAALQGLDAPKAVAVSHERAAEQEPPAPWLSDAVARWKQSDIYAEDLRNAGRTEVEEIFHLKP